MKSIKAIFNDPGIPPEYRSNFFHFYLDIAWFGILSGSSVNFLNVYATRIGANGFQIGLLGAVAALVSLVLAIPTGRWLEKRATGRAVFWTSVFYRIGYLFFVPLPWLFDAPGQVWAIIALTFLMGIPLTALTVGFSTLFAEAVPNDWRAYVTGIRNVLLSVAFMLSSLVSGYLLDRIAFPLNYQIIFFIGFVGAAMSSVHLFFIKPVPKRIQQDHPHPDPAPLYDPRRGLLRMDIWKTPFRNTLLAMLAFHFTQFLAIPLFPLSFVHQLNLTDEALGIGTALFYVTMLIGSIQLNRIVGRLGHKKVTAWGAVGMALYPILLAISSLTWHYYALSLLGGFAWALVGGASLNYLLENCPENDRPAHLAWYNIVMNVAVLAGSLAGPIIAGQIGLSAALLLFGGLRVITGIGILKWG